jgi:hypothetical protein
LRETTFTKSHKTILITGKTNLVCLPFEQRHYECHPIQKVRNTLYAVYCKRSVDLRYKFAIITAKLTLLKGQSHEKVCEIIALNDRFGPN